MNTDQDEFYGTLVTIGSLCGQLHQLLAALDEREVDASVIQHLKSMVLHQHENTIVEKLGIAERCIREIRVMIDKWTADAKARLRKP